ncbi:hypothetical protein [Brevundimonas sp.]|uniref:hypothetical protein n=1 Tax=Brevundimonas sp. TaxID=1871086 RepID=UPI0025EF6DC8|nr:hypothetical protein [Brevundimonas sp.]
MTMTRDRFRTLVHAYGGDPRRWPVKERAAAEAFARDDSEAGDLLALARELDDLLADAPSLEARPEFRQAILDRAPRARRGLRRISRLGWLSGAGWAAAAAAGAVFGVALSHQLLQDWQADAVIEQAAAWHLDEAEYLG